MQASELRKGPWPALSLQHNQMFVRGRSTEYWCRPASPPIRYIDRYIRGSRPFGDKKPSRVAGLRSLSRALPTRATHR